MLAKAQPQVAAQVAWLSAERPWDIGLGQVEVEARTGKYFLGGTDRWGRPVLVMDNTVQNTSDVERQLRGLVFMLWRAMRLMPPGVDKYVVAINLTNFSLLNIPPWSAIRATLQALQEHFPERLGHLVLYQVPWVFQSVYRMAGPLLDANTTSKLVHRTCSLESSHSLARSSSLASRTRAATSIGPCASFSATSGASSPSSASLPSSLGLLPATIIGNVGPK